MKGNTMFVLDHEIPLNDGELLDLNNYMGDVILIVNTASKCGFTPQYEGLEKLYQDYKDQGFVVLGFPCNQFGDQEPGSAEEIMEFCQINYGVTFPIFEKIDVNGENAHPLFKQLKKAKPGLLGSEKIKWNFTKFLVNRKGEVIDRFAPATKPEDLVKHVERELAMNNESISTPASE
jgi:glutathione peroxidase